MKNKIFITLLTLILCGCSVTSPSSPTNNSINNSEEPSVAPSVVPSINEPSIPSVSSSSIEVPSVSNEPSISITPSVETPVNKLSVKEIKEIAKGFKGKENSVGVYESNIEADIDLTLIACLDAVTTKTGYGDRYKILMCDDNDYIYIKTSAENYQYLKQYVNDRSLYNIKGNISLYNNEVEITVSTKPTYLNTSKNINYDNFASLKTLSETYDELNDLKLNCKGISFSKIVKIHAKCLSKDINNTNMYFGNGDYIINVHGNDKVTNKFTKDNNYVLYAALSMHNFRPSLEYVYHTSLNDEDIIIDYSNLETKQASDFYKYTYEVDKDSSYPNYSSMFKHPYFVEGYFNLYIKSNKYYAVIESTYKDTYYSTYQNARSAKTLMIVNENYVGLSDLKYLPVLNELENGTKIKAIVFPYLWNTNDYPQIYYYGCI